MRTEPVELSREQQVELLRGAYNAIDGLWFMAVEERHGNRVARELDEDVWRDWGGVLARQLIRALGLNSDLPESLGTALATWLPLEGWSIELDFSKDRGFKYELKVLGCPWWEIMLRSGRTDAVDCSIVDLAFMEGIAGRFSPDWRVEMLCARSHGDVECGFRFEL